MTKFNPNGYELVACVGRHVSVIETFTGSEVNSLTLPATVERVLQILFSDDGRVALLLCQTSDKCEVIDLELVRS